MAVEERNARIAKNETVFRATNREIENAEEESGGGDDAALEVLCECGRPGCSGLISMTVGQYEKVHSQKDRFVVVPGHQSDEIEKVVEEREGYAIVDKFGEAEEIAEAEGG